MHLHVNDFRKEYPMQISRNKPNLAVIALAVTAVLAGCDSGVVRSVQDVANQDVANQDVTNQGVVSSDPSGDERPVVLPTADTGASDGNGGDSGLVVGSPDTSYDFLRLAGDTECLTVNQAGNYQLIGSYVSSDSQVVSEDLSGFARVGAIADGSVSVISVGDNGISLQLNETTIAAIPISVGEQTTTHYLSAIPTTTEKPIIVARQTQDWCAYVLYGSNGSCASVTNSEISDGQTLSITATSSASVIGPNGDEIVISSRNCELDNPQNIPVLQFGG